MVETQYKFKVDADLKNLEPVSEFISKNARLLGLHDKGIFQLQLAADEVVSNIILHGYSHKTGPIHITLWEEDVNMCNDGNFRVILMIEDRGEPFNPLNVKKPDLNSSLENRPQGGLGIHFLKTLSDDVKYEYIDGKNRLTVSKNIE